MAGEYEKKSSPFVLSRAPRHSLQRGGFSPKRCTKPRRLAAFTSTVYNDEFIAVVRTQGSVRSESSFGALLGSAFRPFSVGLWAALIGTALVVGVSMWIVEGHINDNAFPDAGRGIAEGIYKSLQVAFA